MSRLRTVYGATAAISCSHPSAAAAGWEMLANGGSVVDAALASAAAMVVVQPQACSLGGDAFILVHDAKAKQTYGINASGRSPALTDVASLASGIPQRGPLSCSTPGMVAGWDQLHRRFGKLPWPRLFVRAIELAAKGFPVTPYLAGQTRSFKAILEQNDGATTTFLSGGACNTGALFHQEALAATLADLAEKGAADFYNGRASTSIADCIKRVGGWLSSDDFAACEANWVEPLALPFRGLDVKVMPPNSYGLFMLLQLAALGSVDLSRHSAEAPDRYAALIDAAHAAFELGDTWVADTPNTQDPLSARNIALVRERFGSARTKGPANKGGTSVIAVADAAGNAVAIVQSIFMVYGSGVVDPGTGILLNDRMIGFTTEPGHPNTVAPLKRPAHTLHPVLTFRGDELRHVLLTPGGPGQTLTLAQTLQAMTDHGLTLADAAALPRWSMDLSGTTVVEPSMPTTLVEDLQQLGHTVSVGTTGSPFFGSVEAIERNENGMLAAVADDRREAYAIAL